MTTRTTQNVVRFSAAFQLPGFDAPQPAGEYRIDHDEECIDGASWLAWRGVGGFIHLPAIATPTFDPADGCRSIQLDLEAALEKDHKQP